MPRQTPTLNVDAKEDIVVIEREIGAGKDTEGARLQVHQIAPQKAEVSRKSRDDIRRSQNPEEKTRDIIMYMATDILAEVMAEAEAKVGGVAVAAKKTKASTIIDRLGRDNMRGNKS